MSNLNHLMQMGNNCGIDLSQACKKIEKMQNQLKGINKEILNNDKKTLLTDISTSIKKSVEKV